MAHLKCPEFKLSGNIPENFRNFELRFNDFCIQADYRDLTKDATDNKVEYYAKPQLEISALRSAMPDEALQVIRYTIDPQIDANDKAGLDGEAEAALYGYHCQLPYDRPLHFLDFQAAFTQDHTGLGGTGTSVRNFMRLRCEGQ